MEKLHFLNNSIRVKDILYLYAIGKKSNKIRSHNFNIHHMVGPFNLVELPIIDSTQIHIEGVVFFSYNKCLDRFIKDRQRVILGIGLVVLPEVKPDYRFLFLSFVFYSDILRMRLVCNQEYISLH